MDPLVDLLLLDVNGVLYDYDPEVRVAALGRALGVGPDAVRDALFTSGLEDASDAGEVGPDEYLAEAGRRLGTPLDRETWAAALAGAVTPVPDVLAVVEAVIGRVRCATLSNNGLLVREMVDRVYPDLARLGVEVHVAAEFGEAKPDRDVYLDACERCGADPTRTAFVDDKEANARGAAAAGLHAHHHRDVDGLATFLSDLGLPVDAGR
ncbi:HAD-IA family hydrolase [Iamia majanohamensis]|uniref:HAD-IA family hydrolase n=1 Tax=Iamia majanohamensis TaxID=467976 RepID=A0AAE9YG40_9ACTN|nr:HAD-IA family hydrolase [Iamia majanohamensis]WCO67166.1 HAD-IA family hydrolase [Iamia majanohamensis]